MNTLDELRADIDRLDKKLLNVLGERFSATRKIGYIKKHNQLASADESRFNDLLSLWRDCANLNKIDPDIAESILGLIHHTVVSEHNAISEGAPSTTYIKDENN